MIRINLLGAPKPKSGKKGSAVSMPALDMGGGGSPLIKAVAVLMLFAIGNGVYWYHLDSEKKSIAAQMRLAEQKNRELAEIKARYMERQRQADAYKRRGGGIKQPRPHPNGPGH